MKEIFTQRLVLSEVTAADAQEMFDAYSDPLVGPAAGWAPHSSVDETRQIIEIVFGNRDGVFSIRKKSDRKFIGTVGVIPDPKRENEAVGMLGYALARESWGEGYMTEAAAAAVSYAFENRGLEAVSAYCYPENAASRRVLEKLGFVYEGRLSRCERRFDGVLFDNECYILDRVSADATNNGTHDKDGDVACDPVFTCPLIAVRDVQRSVGFYCGLFGQRVRLDLGENVTLSCGLALQEDFGRLCGTRYLPDDGEKLDMELYFETENFDGFIAKLEKRDDIRYLNPPMKHEWQQRVVRFFDPDGHAIEVGESMRSVARRFLCAGYSPEETSGIIRHPIDFVLGCV